VTLNRSFVKQYDTQHHPEWHFFHSSRAIQEQMIFSYNYNKYVNNIFYSVDFSNFNAKGNKPGLNEFRRNTVYGTDITMPRVLVLGDKGISQLDSMAKKLRALL
jgi:hypothetical protein